MSQVLLDGVENLVAEANDHANEIGTLQMLQHGLMSLATAIKRREMQYAEITKKMKFTFMGATNERELTDLRMIACFFHWFGVSVCNYARLVGFIRGLEKKQFTRNDLQAVTAFKGISKEIKAYVEGISELADVLVWRNKVAGHFAITDPRADDNIATLNMSVMHPVSLENGIYYVGGFTLTQSNPSGTHTSALPMWSVTQVFESLMPRFWPGAKFEIHNEPQASA